MIIGGILKRQFWSNEFQFWNDLIGRLATRNAWLESVDLIKVLWEAPKGASSAGGVGG